MPGGVGAAEYGQSRWNGGNPNRVPEPAAMALRFRMHNANLFSSWLDSAIPVQQKRKDGLSMMVSARAFISDRKGEDAKVSARFKAPDKMASQVMLVGHEPRCRKAH